MPDRMMTPVGLAVYPYLNEPDTQFDENGVYQLQLSLPQKEADTMIKSLEKQYDTAYKGYCKEKKKNQLKKADMPWKDQVDDEGDPTGNVLFRFKMRAKTAKGVELRPLLIDSKRHPVTERIGSGSQVKVAFEAHDWLVPALGVGLSLRLKGVQVIELIEWSGGPNATSLGFEEEEGFETAATAFAEESGDGGDF
jgi:hypothetical protein